MDQGPRATQSSIFHGLSFPFSRKARKLPTPHLGESKASDAVKALDRLSLGKDARGSHDDWRQGGLGAIAAPWTDPIPQLVVRQPTYPALLERSTSFEPLPPTPQQEASTTDPLIDDIPQHNIGHLERGFETSEDTAQLPSPVSEMSPGPPQQDQTVDPEALALPHHGFPIVSLASDSDLSRNPSTSTASSALGPSTEESNVIDTPESFAVDLMQTAGPQQPWDLASFGVRPPTVFNPIGSVHSSVTSSTASFVSFEREDTVQKVNNSFALSAHSSDTVSPRHAHASSSLDSSGSEDDTESYMPRSESTIGQISNSSSRRTHSMTDLICRPRSDSLPWHDDNETLSSPEVERPTECVVDNGVYAIESGQSSRVLGAGSAQESNSSLTLQKTRPHSRSKSLPHEPRILANALKENDRVLTSRRITPGELTLLDSFSQRIYQSDEDDYVRGSAAESQVRRLVDSLIGASQAISRAFQMDSPESWIKVISDPMESGPSTVVHEEATRPDDMLVRSLSVREAPLPPRLSRSKTDPARKKHYSANDALTAPTQQDDEVNTKRASAPPRSNSFSRLIRRLSQKNMQVSDPKSAKTSRPSSGDMSSAWTDFNRSTSDVAQMLTRAISGKPRPKKRKSGDMDKVDISPGAKKPDPHRFGALLRPIMPRSSSLLNTRYDDDWTGPSNTPHEGRISVPSRKSSLQRNSVVTWAPSPTEIPVPTIPFLLGNPGIQSRPVSLHIATEGQVISPAMSPISEPSPLVLPEILTTRPRNREARRKYRQSLVEIQDDRLFQQVLENLDGGDVASMTNAMAAENDTSPMRELDPNTNNGSVVARSTSTPEEDSDDDMLLMRPKTRRESEPGSDGRRQKAAKIGAWFVTREIVQGERRHGRLLARGIATLQALEKEMSPLGHSNPASLASPILDEQLSSSPKVIFEDLEHGHTPAMQFLLTHLPRLLALSMSLSSKFEDDPSPFGLSQAFVSMEHELSTQLGIWSAQVGRLVEDGLGEILDLQIDRTPAVSRGVSMIEVPGSLVSPPNDARLGFADIIIMPVQRALRYRLLFNDLLNKCLLHSPTRDGVQSALDAAERLAMECNSQQQLDLDVFRRTTPSNPATPRRKRDRLMRGKSQDSVHTTDIKGKRPSHKSNRSGGSKGKTKARPLSTGSAIDFLEHL